MSDSFGVWEETTNLVANGATQGWVAAPHIRMSRGSSKRPLVAGPLALRRRFRKPLNATIIFQWSPESSTLWVNGKRYDDGWRQRRMLRRLRIRVARP